MSGRIFVISGPSGVGKGTLCDLLLQEPLNLQLSISATSRPQRDHEENGVQYFFKTRSEFEAMIDQDQVESALNQHQLLEWAEYNGNYYGTPRQTVEKTLQSGKNVLLEIDVQGALQVKAKFSEACLIFIAPPDEEELARRLRGRGTDSDVDIQNRLSIARQELALQNRFDYVVINEQLQTCLAEIKSRCFLS